MAQGSGSEPRFAFFFFFFFSKALLKDYASELLETVPSDDGFRQMILNDEQLLSLHAAEL